MAAEIKRGIILMNLGSPDSTQVKDVKKYLDEFLMDRRVIDTHWLIRLILVRLLITPRRAVQSAHAYQNIWTKEGSPLIVISGQLKKALQGILEEPVELAMRYGDPSPGKAFEKLIEKEPDLREVILLPLYPQYAFSSFESAAEFAKEIFRKKKYPFRLTTLKPFYHNPDYLQTLASHIEPFLKEPYDHILFSFHGIPERHLRKWPATRNHCLRSSDCCEGESPAHAFCYRHQCLRTTKWVRDRLRIPTDKCSYSFQSRLGKDPWLKPYTDFRLTEMPGEGIKKLLIVCPAFVSDCLETLEEIAIRGKMSFLHSGGESFAMIPCLNTDPLWVKSIAKWIGEYKSGNSQLAFHKE
jgi:protoporphyrin/coproporphyrin ferrochelatase